MEDIHLIPGEYVGYEGEGRSLAIVVEGKTELTKLVNGVEEVIGVRLPGELGEQMKGVDSGTFQRETDTGTAAVLELRRSDR